MPPERPVSFVLSLERQRDRRALRRALRLFGFFRARLWRRLLHAAYRAVLKRWRLNREAVDLDDGEWCWCPPCPWHVGSERLCRRCRWPNHDHFGDLEAVERELRRLRRKARARARCRRRGPR